MNLMSKEEASAGLHNKNYKMDMPSMGKKTEELINEKIKEKTQKLLESR